MVYFLFLFLHETVALEDATTRGSQVGGDAWARGDASMVRLEQRDRKRLVRLGELYVKIQINIEEKGRRKMIGR
jgi:hypothetical protein